MRILLVEDNPGDVRLLEEVVADSGAADIGLAHAARLDEGIERAATAEIDLVLLDLSLPDSTGVETVTAMRDRAPGVPIVVLTGTGEREIGLDALRRGAQDYLVKGDLAPEILLRSIRYAVERHRQVEARLAAEREVQRLREEAVELLASSVDYDRAVERIAELVVPRIADGCAIDTCDEDGHLQRAAAVYRDDVLAQPASALPCVALRSGAPLDAAAVVASGEPELMTDVTESALEAAARDREHLRQLREVDPRSCMCVPLVARGEVLGAITFVATAASGRRYGADDVRRAEELARRAAIAVDNARLYEAADRAIRLREQFLSIAAHELYTPLTSLQLTVQALRRGILESSPEAVAQASELSERQVRKLGQLIEALLSASRIRSGRLELQLESVDLAALVARVSEQMHHDASRAGCDVSVHAPGPVVGRWDKQRLEQVVTNLFSNAIKFGAGEPIDVELRDRGARIDLVVRDRGIGIAPDRLPQIFDRFERGVPERQYGGLGLGLFIVREIVRAHGGDVSVESDVGAGSTFTVELPRAPPPESAR